MSLEEQIVVSTLSHGDCFLRHNRVTTKASYPTCGPVISNKTTGGSSVCCLRFKKTHCCLSIGHLTEQIRKEQLIHKKEHLGLFLLAEKSRNRWEIRGGWAKVILEVFNMSHFLAGAVFCRFHILSVWSSEAVMRTGSTGWKLRARIPSKWLRRVNLGFHVFLMASLLLPIWGEEVLFRAINCTATPMHKMLGCWVKMACNHMQINCDFMIVLQNVRQVNFHFL